MSRDDIASKIVILVSEESGRQARLADLLIDDLGLDSLSFVNLAAKIETAFDMSEIPDSDLFKLVTVEQVVDYVCAWLRVRDDAQAARV